MTNSFTIYESAMCCSSGVCGPNPDKSLIELQDALDKLKAMDCEVERYSITQSPNKFRENPAIIKLIQEQQIKALPITTFAGRIIKVGSYPSIAELVEYLANGNKSSPSPQESTGSEACCPGKELNTSDGCCSGQSPCDISCGPNYRGVPKVNIKGKCC